jgi:hypothetical protein
LTPFNTENTSTALRGEIIDRYIDGDIATKRRGTICQYLHSKKIKLISFVKISKQYLKQLVKNKK